VSLEDEAPAPHGALLRALAEDVGLEAEARPEHARLEVDGESGGLARSHVRHAERLVEPALERLPALRGAAVDEDERGGEGDDCAQRTLRAHRGIVGKEALARQGRWAGPTGKIGRSAHDRARRAADNRPDPPAAVTQETATLYEDIRALLEEPPGSEATGFIERLEHTLTDGYARALALEAERVRLERRMGELAGDLHGDPDAPTAELATVVRRLSDADEELTDLRGALAKLRVRVRALRVA